MWDLLKYERGVKSVYAYTRRPHFPFLGRESTEAVWGGGCCGLYLFFWGFNSHEALQGIPLAPWPENGALCAGQVQPAKLLWEWGGGKLHEPCRRVVLEQGAYLITFPELFIEAQSGKVAFS